MSNPPSYRRLAEMSLDLAGQQLNTLPHGLVANDVMIACSTNAQAVATVAVAQALLEIGDVLRQLAATDG